MGTAKKDKREYSTEFKIDAARLVKDQGYTVKETCERLGIPPFKSDEVVKPVP